MLEILNKLKETLGMDSNSFYPLLATITVPILSPVILSLLNLLINTIRNRWFHLHYRQEFEGFYALIIILQILMVFAGSFVASFCFALILLPFTLFQTTPSHTFTIIFVSILVFILGIISTNRILKFPWVRKRIFGDKNAKKFFYAPIIIMTLFFVANIYKNNHVLYILIETLFVICECVGLWHFRSRYIEYPFSCLRLFTNDGNIIDCEDISKIQRKWGGLIITQATKQLRIKYEHIVKVEYYGEPLIILQDDLFKKK